MKETSLCYLEHDERYLMLLRNKKENDPNKNKWIGVGGKLEKDESPFECAKREIYEETGIDANNLLYRGRVFFKSDIYEDELMHLFTADCIADTFTPCNEGELCWIPKKDVLSLNLWEGDRVFLEYLLDQRQEFFEIFLSYEGDKLISVQKKE